METGAAEPAKGMHHAEARGHSFLKAMSLYAYTVSGSSPGSPPLVQRPEPAPNNALQLTRYARR